MFTIASLRRVLPGLLLALAVVPVIAAGARLSGLIAGTVSAADARFAAAPWPIVLHILAVVPYALLGALQVVPGAQRTSRHRAAGKWLVPLGFLSAVTGLWMTLTYPWPTGDGVALYVLRLVAGTGMIAAIVRGIVAMRQRDWATHGAWMLRGYALGMGAGTQVLTHLPWFLFVDGAPDETSRAVLMGLGWAINLVVAEFVIHRQNRRVLSAPAGSVTHVLGR